MKYIMRKEKKKKDRKIIKKELDNYYRNKISFKIVIIAKILFLKERYLIFQKKKKLQLLNNLIKKSRRLLTDKIMFL